MPASELMEGLNDETPTVPLRVSRSMEYDDCRTGAQVDLSSLSVRPMKIKGYETTRAIVTLDEVALSAGAYLSKHLMGVGLSKAIRFALIQTAKREGWRADSVPPPRMIDDNAERS